MTAAVSSQPMTFAEFLVGIPPTLLMERRCDD
jgi:hypothetical protein